MVDPAVRKRFAEVIDRLVAETGLDYKNISVFADLGETYVRDAIKRGRGKESEFKRILNVIDPGTLLADYVILGRGSPKDVDLLVTLAAYSVSKRKAEENPYRVTVIGRVGAGAEIHPEFEQIDETEGLFEIVTRVPIVDGSIAFEVEGDSMWPRYHAGDVIICDRNGIVSQSDLVGVEAVVRTQDGRRLLKQVRKGSRAGLFNLESHNAAPIADVKLEWASEVEQVVRSKKWRKLDRAAQQHLVARVTKKRR